MRSLDIAGTGMQAQQTNVEVISNNIANMTTTGLQAAPGGVPGPDLPEPAPRRLQQLGHRHHRAVRRAGRARRADRGDLPHQRAGQPAADVEHAGHGDPGQRLFPGDAALGRHRLYPRRHVRPGGRRHDCHRRRLYRAARHADPIERHRRHGECLRPGAGHAAGPDRAADRRPVADSRHSPTRRGSMRGARTCSCRPPPPASRSPATPGRPGSARSCRASSRPPTSTSSPRSPRAIA